MRRRAFHSRASLPVAILIVVAHALHSCLGGPPGRLSSFEDAGDAASDAADAAGDAGDAGDAAVDVGNTDGGLCSNRDAGASCSRNGAPGVCSELHTCVECLREGDGRCAGERPHCTSASTCAECTVNEHCHPTREKCHDGSCVIRCGDGVIDSGEDCEVGMPGWTVATCDYATCKRTLYRLCADGCGPNALCIAGDVCWEQIDSECVETCPALPGYDVACFAGFCHIDCSTGSCPSDTRCESAPELSACTGAPEQATLRTLSRSESREL